MFKKSLAIVLIIGALLGCVGCAYANTHTDKLEIVTTLFPQYDFARQIVGDKGSVNLLLPAGMESHTFEPSPKDIIDIKNSDLFIFTGENMENWAKSLMDEKNALDISANITLSEGRDPHIWTSPKNAKIIVSDIAHAIINADEKNKEYYEKNLNEYLKKLDALDEELSNIPKEKPIVFGGRNAFYYLINDYGFNAISAYDNCSDHSEPSAKGLKDIMDTMKEKSISTVYFEELSNNDVAKTISEETGAAMLLLHSVHNIAKDDSDATYINLMEQNIENLKKGLN